jgi:hypothetical protein
MFAEMTYETGRIERLPLQRVRLFAKLKKLWKASRGTPPHYDLVQVLNRRIEEKRLNHSRPHQRADEAQR